MDASTGQALVPLALEGDVDIMIAFFLHDDQQDDADERHHREVGASQQQREDRADAGRRQGGEDRERVNVAAVEHSEDDVDGEQRGEDQDRLVRQRCLECLGRALEAAVDARR